GLLTKAQAVVLTNSKTTENHLVACEFDNKTGKRNQNSFTENPKSILNFWTDNNEFEIIKYIYNLPHTTLKNKAVIGMGIVTGNNSPHCNSETQKGLIPVYKGSDISENGLKNPTNRIEKDLQKYQRTAPERVYRSEEKLIYKSISHELCFYGDTQQRYI